MNVVGEREPVPSISGETRDERFKQRRAFIACVHPLRKVSEERRSEFGAGIEIVDQRAMRLQPANAGPDAALNNQVAEQRYMFELDGGNHSMNCRPDRMAVYRHGPTTQH